MSEWRVERGLDGWHIIEGEGEYHTVIAMTYHGHGDRQLAIAKDIANVPAVLEALADILNYTVDWSIDTDANVEAIKAIASRVAT